MFDWDFPGGERLTPTGSNHAGIETFLDDIPKSLTREVIQNSLDAHVDGSKNPVMVQFVFNKINSNNIFGREALLKNIVPQAKIFWQKKNNVDTLAFIEEFEKVLTQDQISVLTIRDFYTTGLTKESFTSLIEGDAYSEKLNDDAAGSKGIGKAAPFAASALRMVIYNSEDVEHESRAAGVINFVSFTPKGKDEDYVTQARGRLCKDCLKVNFSACQNNGSGKDQFNISSLPIIGELRKTNGTDLHILGLKELDNWQDRIILAVLNNFLVSIFNGELVVNVDGKFISNNSLAFVIDEYKAAFEGKELKLDSQARVDFNNTCIYYEVLKSTDTKIIYLPDEWISNYSFINNMSDGVLYLNQGEKATRRVLQTRKSGMRISEKNRISGSINFTGVFRATGKDFNKFLRKLENVNHDQWSTDRLKDSERKEANDFLKDLYKWYKDTVRSEFEVIEEDEIDAIGVGNLLPLDRNAIDNKQMREDSGIIPRLKSINTLKSAISHTYMESESEERRTNRLMEEVLVGEGNSSGSGSRRTGEGNGNSPNNEHGLGNLQGEKGESPNGSPIISEVLKEIGTKETIQFRVIEIDAAKGTYLIVGQSNSDYDGIAFSLSSIGENGETYNKRILSVVSDDSNAALIQGKVIFRNISKGRRFSGKIQLEEKLRIRLKGTIYEVIS